MIEETHFQPAFDLGMGLQQGFERFADEALRPLASAFVRANNGSTVCRPPVLPRAQSCSNLVQPPTSWPLMSWLPRPLGRQAV